MCYLVAKYCCPSWSRWCENESDAVVSSGDHRSRRERGGVTGVGRGARHGQNWWSPSAQSDAPDLRLPASNPGFTYTSLIQPRFHVYQSLVEEVTWRDVSQIITWGLLIQHLLQTDSNIQPTQLLPNYVETQPQQNMISKISAHSHQPVHADVFEQPPLRLMSWRDVIIVDISTQWREDQLSAHLSSVMYLLQKLLSSSQDPINLAIGGHCYSTSAQPFPEWPRPLSHRPAQGALLH